MADVPKLRLAPEQERAFGDDLCEQVAESFIGLVDACVRDAGDGDGDETLDRPGLERPRECFGRGDVGAGPPLGARCTVEGSADDRPQSHVDRLVGAEGALDVREARRDGALALLARDGQCGRPGEHGDERVGPRVVGRESDDRRDERCEFRPFGVGCAVVDAARERGERRMGAGGVVAPGPASEVRREFHEARTPARVSVPASRQHRHDVGGEGMGLVHESLRVGRSVLQVYSFDRSKTRGCHGFAR